MNKAVCRAVKYSCTESRTGRLPSAGSVQVNLKAIWLTMPPGPYDVVDPVRRRPFGYRYTYSAIGRINGLVIDPYEAEIIHEVALRLCHGESAHSIALELERREVPTVSGAQWQRMMVVRLVKPVSAGMINHNGWNPPRQPSGHYY